MAAVCAPDLLYHDYRVGEVLEHLLAHYDPPCVLLITETLERGHVLLRRVLRRALRCPDDTHGLEAAAVLALVDEPWCARVLVKALAAHARSDDPYGCWLCLAALRERRDPAIQKLLADIEVARRDSGDGLEGRDAEARWEREFREALDSWRPLVRDAGGPG